MEAKRHARRGRIGSHAVGPVRHDVRARVAVGALDVVTLRCLIVEAEEILAKEAQQSGM